jgi:hypothetical protein
MRESMRIVVTTKAFQKELLAKAPSNLVAESGPPEHGFGETLYPILLTAGVATLPVGVVSGMIANWIGDALKSRKSAETETIGLEADGKIETITLTNVDVDRIAQRVVALLSERPDDDSAN